MPLALGVFQAPQMRDTSTPSLDRETLNEAGSIGETDWGPGDDWGDQGANNKCGPTTSLPPITSPPFIRSSSGTKAMKKRLVRGNAEAWGTGTYMSQGNCTT
ncbi:hypothetical protein Bbelb_153770 [Branchiostoma belcheri]|nr:hypothetical protein Bbelb_153770 [Branchiostoma belcheri]